VLYLKRHQVHIREGGGRGERGEGLRTGQGHSQAKEQSPYECDMCVCVCVCVCACVRAKDTSEQQSQRMIPCQFLHPFHPNPGRHVREPCSFPLHPAAPLFPSPSARNSRQRFAGGDASQKSSLGHSPGFSRYVCLFASVQAILPTSTTCPLSLAAYLVLFRVALLLAVARLLP
jgi:hypothetical protein